MSVFVATVYLEGHTLAKCPLFPQLTLSLMAIPFSHSPEEKVPLSLTTTCSWGGSSLPPVYKQFRCFPLYLLKQMNYSYRKNNEVEYCSRVIYCLRPNTNSRFSQVFTVTRYNPTPTLYHNYILRIYLKNYTLITPTLQRRKAMRL